MGGESDYLEDAELDGAVDDADTEGGDPGHLQSNIHREDKKSVRQPVGQPNLICEATDESATSIARRKNLSTLKIRMTRDNVTHSNPCAFQT